MAMPLPSPAVPGLPQSHPGRDSADGRGPKQAVLEHRGAVRDELNLLDALPVSDGAAQHQHGPSDVYRFPRHRIHDLFAAVCALHKVLCGAEHLSVLLSRAEPKQLPLHGLFGVV